MRGPIFETDLGDFVSEGSFFFQALPPEIREHFEAQRDLQNMERRDFQNRLRSFMDALTPEHLVTLREILSGVSNGHERLAPYLEGQITAMLHYKHDVCICCGQPRHEDEQLNTLLQPKESEVQPEQMPLPFPTDEIIAPDILRPEEWEENLEIYNLRIPNEGEVASSPGEKPVICIGCGTLYQSLEDRMLKRPGIEGCDGCISKQKWG